VAITGKAVDPSFTGTRANWTELAENLRADIIITSGRDAVEQIEGYRGAALKRFIVLDAEGIPLQRMDNGSYLSTAENLPPRLSAWIEAHGGI
jgi:hypothetical protein